MKKDIYLVPFLEQLHGYFGHLIMLADANYATKKLMSWFHGKNRSILIGRILETYGGFIDSLDTGKYLQGIASA